MILSLISDLRTLHVTLGKLTDLLLFALAFDPFLNSGVTCTSFHACGSVRLSAVVSIAVFEAPYGVFDGNHQVLLIFFDLVFLVFC